MVQVNPKGQYYNNIINIINEKSANYYQIVCDTFYNTAFMA